MEVAELVADFDFDNGRLSDIESNSYSATLPKPLYSAAIAQCPLPLTQAEQVSELPS